MCNRIESKARWMQTQFCLFAFVFLHIPSTTKAASNTDANRLYEDLMMSYNRFVRPVQNDSDTLVVKLGLKLSQLIDVVSRRLPTSRQSHPLDHNNSFKFDD